MERNVMTCKYCKDTGWYLYKENAPSPPYNQGSQLEFTKRCVCQNEYQRPKQEYQD